MSLERNDNNLIWIDCEMTGLEPNKDRIIEVAVVVTSPTYNGVTTRFVQRGGRYWVATDGPDGVVTEYPVAYTFGVYPLQQYLVPFPRGRYQALGIAWDAPEADNARTDL